MKFFDPKKKENQDSPSPYPQPQATAPIPQPVQATPQPVAPAPPKVTPLPPVEPPVQASRAPEIRPVPAPAPSSAPAAVGQTVLGANIIIHGDVTAEENVIIDGVVDGTIETSCDVKVGREGKVHATIRAANVTIAGRVIGDIFATNKVDLLASALLQGNIRAPKLSIADSALFKGTIDMRSPADAAAAYREKSTKKAMASTPLESVQS